MTVVLPKELVSVITAGAFRQFQALAHLMEGHEVIFDIGCGLAILPMFIARNFPIKTVHLMDGDGTGEARGGYHTGTKAWADVCLGGAVVRANTNVAVIEHVAPVPVFPFKPDFIISSRSWGHHYPVEVYAPLAAQILTPAGVIIMDIRNNTDGVEKMRAAGFETFDRIDDPSPKCRRLAFRRIA